MESQTRKTIHDYEKVWKEWQLGADLDTVVQHHRNTRGRFLDLLAGLIEKFDRGSVLELGCGTAVDLGLLAAKFKNCRFYASDLSFQAARVANKVSTYFDNRIKVYISNIQDLPLSDNSTDLVYTQGVMEHFEQPEPLFAEQIRVLKPGGFLVVNVPQTFTGYTVHKHKEMKKGTWELGWETEFSCFSLNKLIKQFGLTETKRMGYGYWKSQKEPAFVIRDMGNKVKRLPLIKSFSPFQLPSNGYTRLWEYLESRWGYLFMQNLVMVFKK